MSIFPEVANQFFRFAAESKKEKAEKINAKIENKKIKNDKLQNKINKTKNKIKDKMVKLERIKHIDKFISNMFSPEGRKENFVNSLQEFRKWSLESNQKKFEKINNKILHTENILSSDKIWSTEKLKLTDKLKKYNNKKDDIETRIQKLN